MTKQTPCNNLDAVSQSVQKYSILLFAELRRCGVGVRGSIGKKRRVFGITRFT